MLFLAPDSAQLRRREVQCFAPKSRCTVIKFSINLVEFTYRTFHFVKMFGGNTQQPSIFGAQKTTGEPILITSKWESSSSINVLFIGFTFATPSTAPATTPGFSFGNMHFFIILVMYFC